MLQEPFDVQVEEGVIHTVCYKDAYNSSQIPILLIHGIGGAIPSFYKMYNRLAKNRPVYGIDLPGFGLSSRINFPNKAEDCEKILVDMIEQWRKHMNIESMVVIGHSFGGYISSKYAVAYRERVNHLCLIESWGFNPIEEKNARGQYRMLKNICGITKVNAFGTFQKVGNETIGELNRTAD